MDISKLTDAIFDGYTNTLFWEIKIGECFINEGLIYKKIDLNEAVHVENIIDFTDGEEIFDPLKNREEQ